MSLAAMESRSQGRALDLTATIDELRSLRKDVSAVYRVLIGG